MLSQQERDIIVARIAKTIGAGHKLTWDGKRIVRAWEGFSVNDDRLSIELAGRKTHVGTTFGDFINSDTYGALLGLTDAEIAAVAAKREEGIAYTHRVHAQRRTTDVQKSLQQMAIRLRRYADDLDSEAKRVERHAYYDRQDMQIAETIIGIPSNLRVSDLLREWNEMTDARKAAAPYRTHAAEVCGGPMCEDGGPTGTPVTCPRCIAIANIRGETVEVAEETIDE